MKAALLLLALSFTLILSPLVTNAQGRRLIAVYEDGRDFPAGWGMFDVKEVRLYEESSGNYSLEVIFYEAPRPKGNILYEPPRLSVYIDYDSNKALTNFKDLKARDSLAILLPAVKIANKKLSPRYLLLDKGVRFNEREVIDVTYGVRVVGRGKAGFQSITYFIDLNGLQVSERDKLSICGWCEGTVFEYVPNEGSLP